MLAPIPHDNPWTPSDAVDPGVRPGAHAPLFLPEPDRLAYAARHQAEVAFWSASAEGAKARRDMETYFACRKAADDYLACWREFTTETKEP